MLKQVKHRRCNTQANDSWSTIAGDMRSTVLALAMFLAAFDTDVACQALRLLSQCSGEANNASGACAAIGGGSSNVAEGINAHIGGGDSNLAPGDEASISGGYQNTADGVRSVVAGGATNEARGYAAFIGGGSSNKAIGQRSVIAGGRENVARGYAAFVGGGGANTLGYGANVARRDWAVVTGGWSNSAIGMYSFVGGGSRLTALGNWSSIGGGSLNKALGKMSTVTGGALNTASGSCSVSGGYTNAAHGGYSSVGGGHSSTAVGNYATIAGGLRNTALGSQSAVGGGTENYASETWATIGGGWQNTAGYLGRVGGGGRNFAAMRASVGGGIYNSASGYYAAVSGGRNNDASGSRSSVLGGIYNTATGLCASIAGGGATYDYDIEAYVDGNTASGAWSFVGGGTGNTVSGLHSASLGSYAIASDDQSGVLAFSGETCESAGENTVHICAPGGLYVNNIRIGNASQVAGSTSSSSTCVGSGYQNTANGERSVVVGGETNEARGYAAFIGGGSSNQAIGPLSAIAGGRGNVARGYGAFVGGGGMNTLGWGENTALRDWAVVTGGWSNSAVGIYSFVGGGWRHTASGNWSTVAGGSINKALGYASAVTGGVVNTAYASCSIAAGYNSLAKGAFASVGGGHSSTAAANYATVAGGAGNAAHGVYATVSGGHYNVASATYAAIGGGWMNTADNRGTIAGGSYNFADISASVGGGYSNSATGYYSAIPGGHDNMASGSRATVSGGRYNTANGFCASIAGGGATYDYDIEAYVDGNTASGAWSFVGGGTGNTVSGLHSASLGSYAIASDDQSGVLAFSGETCESAGENTVHICAPGGLFVNNVLVGNASQSASSSGVPDSIRISIQWLEENVTMLNDDVDGLMDSLTRVNNSWRDSFEMDVAALQHNFSTIFTDVQDVKSDVAQLENSVGDVKTSAYELNESVAHLRLNLTAHGRSIYALQESVWGHADRISDTEENVVHLATDAVNINGSIAHLRQSLEWLNANTSIYFDNVDANIMDLQRNASFQQRSLVEFADLIRAQSTSITELERTVGDSTSNATSLASHVDMVSRGVDMLNLTIYDHESSLNELQLTVVDLDQRVENCTLELQGLDVDLRTNMSVLGEELIEINSRIDLLDGNTSLALMKDVAFDVKVLETNVSQLDADIVKLKESITTANDSLTQLELLDIAILASNVTTLWKMQGNFEQDLASIRQFAHNNSGDVARLMNSTASQDAFISELQTQQVDLWNNASLQQSALTHLTRTMEAVNTSLQRIDVVTGSLLEKMTHSDSNASLQWQWLVRLDGEADYLRGNVTAHQETLDGLKVAVAEGAVAIDLLTTASGQLNNSMLSQSEAMLDMNRTIEDNGEEIKLLRAASLEEWTLNSQQEVKLGALEVLGHVLNHTVAEHGSKVAQLELEIEQQNSTIMEKDIEIERLKSAIVGMNWTAQEQQHEIDYLKSTVEMMNSTVASLTLAFANMGAATTFAAVADPTADASAVGCGDTSAAPCGTTGTAAPQQVVVTEVDAASASLSACYHYPCTADADVFAWDREVILAADTDGNAVEYKFALQAGNDIVWEDVSNGRFASFTPSDLGVSPAVEYELSMTVQLDDGRSATAVIDKVTFASAPTIHGVTINWVNGSAALDWFEVAVNATDPTDPTDLVVEYWLVSTEGGWKYEVGSDASDAVLVAVAATREFSVEVVVTNSAGSSTACSECAALVAPPRVSNSSDVVAEDVLKLVRDGELSTAVLLAAIDTGDTSLLTEVFSEFLQMLRANATSTVSQDVVALHEFVHAGVVDGFMDAIDFIGSRVEGGPVLSMFLETMDEYGRVVVAAEDALDGMVELDEYLNSACVANKGGDVPDGEVTTFDEASYSLSCALTDSVVQVQAGAATLVASVDVLSTVTVSMWNRTMNVSNGTAMIAGIHGIHVDGDGQDVADAEDVTDGVSLAMAVDGGVESVRKAMSCRYYNDNRRTWSTRGVVLRGMAFESTVGVSAICLSSHMTLFTIGDSLAATKVVESKVQSLARRVDDLNNVDLLTGEDRVNWGILGAFLGTTVLFVVVIVVAKVRGRKEAVERGRLVFHQDGQLSKPNTMGSAEYEAILRTWVGACATVKLMVFEVLTSNAVLGLFFHWDHEAVVFGRADKAVILFGAVLMTFISSAFLFDPHESLSSDPLVLVWSALVSALLTNILLLPVQHFLPYMVSNVNSVTTLSPMPLSLLKREMKRLSCWRPVKRKKSPKEVQAQILLHWAELTFGCADDREVTTPRTRVNASTTLNFATCAVSLPTASAVGEGARDVAAVGGAALDGVVRLQRVFRRHSGLKRDARNVEFEAWYRGQKRQRHFLATLSAAVLLVLATFALVVCLLLSATFNDDESVMWATDVSQSLVVQIFLTDPIVTVLVICFKLFVSWLLLRMGKKRMQKKLEERRRLFEQQAFSVAADADVVNERVHALQLVKQGDVELVREETERQQTAKRRCQVALQGIAAAKARIVRKRTQVAQPKQIQVERWDSEQAALIDKEARTRKTLRLVEAALDVLVGDPDDADEQLRDAQDTLARLRKTLTQIAKKKESISRRVNKLDDDKPKAVKKNSVVPVSDIVEEVEPDVERAVMPKARLASTTSAVAGAGDGADATRVSVVTATDLSVTSRTRSAGARRVVPVVRKGARRRRVSMRAKKPQKPRQPQADRSGINRAQTAVFTNLKGSSATKKRSAPKRRAMTWAEIRALQAQLRAKAGKEAATSARRRISTRHMPSKVVKIMLARREKRRRMLEAKAESAAISARVEHNL